MARTLLATACHSDLNSACHAPHQDGGGASQRRRAWPWKDMSCLSHVFLQLLAFHWTCCLSENSGPRGWQPKHKTPLLPELLTSLKLHCQAAPLATSSSGPGELRSCGGAFTAERFEALIKDLCAGERVRKLACCICTAGSS